MGRQARSMVVSRNGRGLIEHMPDQKQPNARGLFGGVFARGGVEASDPAWLQAMLDVEAALARALERAGMAPAGSGEEVTAAAQAANFEVDELGELAGLTGNPVPGLVRELARQVPQSRGQRRPPGRHQPGHHGHRRHAAGPAVDRRHPGRPGPRPPPPRPRLAAEHRATIMIGRTLLQQAVPVTFGLVAAGWLTGLDEAPRRAGPRSRQPSGGAVRRGGGHARPRSATAGPRSRRCSRWNSAWRCPRPAVAHRPAADHRDRRGLRWRGPRGRSARSPVT